MIDCISCLHHSQRGYHNLELGVSYLVWQTNFLRIIRLRSDISKIIRVCKPLNNSFILISYPRRHFVYIVILPWKTFIIMDSSLDDDNLELSDIEATGEVTFHIFTRYFISASSYMTMFAVSLKNSDTQNHDEMSPIYRRLRRVDNIIRWTEAIPDCKSFCRVFVCRTHSVQLHWDHRNMRSDHSQSEQSVFASVRYLQWLMSLLSTHFMMDTPGDQTDIVMIKEPSRFVLSFLIYLVPSCRVL